jgi:thiol-disulfide isomerase/thioredoxin
MLRWHNPFGSGAGDTTTMRLPPEGELPSFDGATEWLNSGPLAPQAVRGRVVLVNFGTYTCINWIRSLPYVRAWADKYAGHGLSVIGIQTPEFNFEGDLDNVRRAVKDVDVRYPLAVDNGYTIWRAFDNHYWPALYFGDAEGRLRHHHFGEGEYEGSERVLQALLTEAGVGNLDRELARVEPQGVELGADWDNLLSPENYVGFQRTEGFASPGGPVLDERHVYTAPSSLRRNEWALAGDWRMSTVSVALAEPGGVISCRFHARDLHLVMGPAMREAPVRFRLRLDGDPPATARGLDVDDDGNGTVTWQRLYQLVRQPGPIVDRLFEVEFLDAGVEAFVFTFG